MRSPIPMAACVSSALLQAGMTMHLAHAAMPEPEDGEIAASPSNGDPIRALLAILWSGAVAIFAMSALWIGARARSRLR
jgi:hypothetical protein